MDKHEYISELFGAENENIIAARRSAPHSAGMQIPPEEGRILDMLVRTSNARNVLEIGTFVGCSTLYLANNCSGSVHTIEHKHEHYEIAKKNFTNSNLNCKIKQYLGSAIDVIADFQDIKFDMIFIDADKVNYYNYLIQIEPLLNDDAVIVAHNVLLFGSVMMDTVPDEMPKNLSKKSWYEMKKFNNRISERNLYISTMIPSKEGLSISIKLP